MFKKMTAPSKSHKKVFIIAGISLAVLAIGGTIIYFVKKRSEGQTGNDMIKASIKAQGGLKKGSAQLNTAMLQNLTNAQK